MEQHSDILFQLRKLSAYYRDIIAAFTDKGGRQLHDLSKVRSGAILADLSPFIKGWQELLDSEEILIALPRVSQEKVSEVVSRSTKEEEAEISGDNNVKVGDVENEQAAESLLAMYRKQEQDPYNRETLIGFPIISGTYGNVRYCAPLFYFRVRLEYMPLRDILKLVKQDQTPVFNTPLLDDLIDEDGRIDVRNFILPELHGKDFSITTVANVVDILARVPAFRGLRKDTLGSVPVAKAISNIGSLVPTVFQACIMVNARKSHTDLLDDLTTLTKLENYPGGTAAERFLTKDAENIEEIGDPDSPKQPTPLLFPLESNLPQRRAARKAERSQLITIEGPPGTGKSQTIANLVCHLTAQGHTVLVTSHQNKALEVVMEKLPRLEDESERDYLAMAMLKGEAESARQLAGKLKYFDATVASGSFQQLEFALKDALERVERNTAEIRRLRVRFSELKNLERRAASQQNWHYRYHDIKEYDGIHPQDKVAEENQASIAAALGQWAELTEGLRERWKDICSFLLTTGISEDAAQVAERAALIKEVLILCNEAEDFVKDPLASKVLNISSVDHPEQVHDALFQLAEWLRVNRDKMLGLLAQLASTTEPTWGIRETMVLLRERGTIPIELVKQALSMEDQARRLTPLPITGYEGVPSQVQIQNADYALSRVELSAKSWLRWHLSWDCFRHRHLLENAGFGKLGFRACSGQLSAIKLWIDQWKFRYWVIHFLHYASELGLPADSSVQLSSPPAAIMREAAHIRTCAELLGLLADRPMLVMQPRNAEVLQQLLEGIHDFDSLELVINTLTAAVGHQKRVMRLLFLCQKPVLRDLWKERLRGYDTFISRLDRDADAAESIKKMKELSASFENFVKVLQLQQKALISLPRTLAMARGSIVNGNFPAWLRRPNEAVEAHRLRWLIDSDLKVNPDDISDVASRLRDLGQETRKIIVQVLRRQRRLALWQAAHDNHINTEIDKFRRLLTKKRKTISLVELRGQVDYRAILKVFPCWVMGIEDVARIFPLEAGLFDYVIVDEASQCAQATALHLAYRGKRMIVVGDEKQLQNPWVRFLPPGLVQLLLQKHDLHQHPNKDVLDAKVSLLGLSTRCSNSQEFLNEHFRSEPAIIAWSNKHFYSDNLKILTPIWPRRFEPCMELRFIRGADEDTEDTKINHLEAKAVIQELRKLVEDPEYEGLTFGIISPFRPQADILQDLIYRELADHPDWINTRRLVASTADGFQGDERDVILYSFRYGPSSKSGSIHAIEMEEERLNVAFTRARRKVICFVSLPPDQFPWPTTPPREKSIRGFLEYALSEQSSPRGRFGAETGDHFGSNFERDVCQGLRSRGIKVYTQVPCAGFRIDLVIVDDEGRRLAVECDGDFHYEEGDLRPDDYHRQDIIERAGWSVHRVSFRRFYANPEKSLELIAEALSKQTTESEALVRDIEKKPKEEAPPAPSEIVSPLVIREVKGEYEAKPQDMVLAASMPSKDESLQLEGVMAISKNWFNMASRGRIDGFLKPYDRGFAFNIGRYLQHGWPLTTRQTRHASQVWKQAIESGWKPLATIT